MSFRWFAHAIADPGRARESLEDTARVEHLPQGGLVAIVCDGVGGHAGGEIASEVAMLAILEVLRAETAGASPATVHRALNSAHEAVLVEAAQRNLQGMGTTAVIAWFEGSSCLIGWVGDSRAYVFRQNACLCKTIDHTRVAVRVGLGELTQEQADLDPDAHVLTQALGGAASPAPSVWQGIPLEAGDVVLLCSDGLHDVLDDAAIGAIVAGRAYSEAVPALIAAANEGGGPDNIGVAVVVVDRRQICGGAT
jgi:protein phosphatase